MRRAAIIAAAAAVFGEHGLDGASMRMIAQRAGCTTGAIYPLFASKEDLYAELLNTSLAQLYTHVASAAARRSKGPAHERAALAFLDYYLARPNEVNLGLFAFQGLKARGVGKQHDRDLNQALARTLALLSPETPGPMRPVSIYAAWRFSPSSSARWCCTRQGACE